MSYTKNCSVRS